MADENPTWRGSITYYTIFVIDLASEDLEPAVRLTPTTCLITERRQAKACGRRRTPVDDLLSPGRVPGGQCHDCFNCPRSIVYDYRHCAAPPASAPLTRVLASAIEPAQSAGEPSRSSSRRSKTLPAYPHHSTPWELSTESAQGRLERESLFCSSRWVHSATLSGRSQSRYSCTIRLMD